MTYTSGIIASPLTNWTAIGASYEVDTSIGRFGNYSYVNTNAMKMDNTDGTLSFIARQIVFVSASYF